ncbi:GP88 family protein, partial [Modestobacter versicolor]|uniref:GP88 family protein n=1 Tax=Modestobacter versicolor TaxID=429133 RepID=UPI0015E8A7BE
KGVRFYDYTKIANRMLNPDKSMKKLPDNYHLTLSSTGLVGDRENWGDLQHVLRQGGSGAMVFRTLAGRGTPGKKNYRPPAELPKYLKWTHEGVPHVAIVADGDEHDLRFKDKEIAEDTGAYEQAQKDHPGAVIVKGVVAGLRLKGGKKDIEEAGEFAVDMGDGHTIDV